MVTRFGGGPRMSPCTIKHAALVVGVFLLLLGLTFLQPMDGYGGWFLSLFAQKEDTVYAPRYTDSSFRKIKIGMTEQDVMELVGKPLEAYAVERRGRQCVGWRFSRSEKGTSYKVRSILFSDGRVFEVFRDFYLD